MMKRTGFVGKVCAACPGAGDKAIHAAAKVKKHGTALVLRSIMGTKKTAVYVALVIVMATFTGMLYGALCPN